MANKLKKQSIIKEKNEVKITTKHDNMVWTSFEKYVKNYKIKVFKMDGLEMEFDLMGTEPAIANAFRRIMLAEVPSMAIEKVGILNNTSIIQDEVLAHRLGLIPLKADPRLFEYCQDTSYGTEFDTLEYSLKVKCTKKLQPRNSHMLNDLYENHCVYSSHIKWHPLGNQAAVYKEESVGPIHSDILIAKMNPGHELDLQLTAVKGIGKDHAKFSPVATASYRLLPYIKLKREVTGQQAELLQSCFCSGVINIDPEGRAYVNNARYDNGSRRVFTHEELQDSVEIGKVDNHFIFTVESVGAMSPSVIFVESVKILRDKCKSLLISSTMHKAVHHHRLHANK